MNKYPAAVCVVIKKDNKYLCGSRRGTDNQWGLIGGKVDPMERYNTAMVRELFEETGIQIETSDIVGVYLGLCGPGLDGRIFECMAFAYIGDVDKLNPKSMEDGILVDWRDEKDLITGPFAEYNKKLLEKIK